MPVFKPSDAAPGTSPSPSWEPGVVEVPQFREGVRPEVQVAEADAPPQISSPTDADLTPLNRILRQHRLHEVEPTFETSPEVRKQPRRSQRRGIETPNLRHFVTLRFPTDAEVRRMAQELNQLEDVEQAAPVPRAVPPQTPQR